MTERIIRTGGCLCGGVRYTIRGPARPILACHCEQCRRTSGNYVAMTSAAPDDLVLDRAETLVWYVSSPEARRGFCSVCGGNLFWAPAQGDRISIAAGTLDTPTGLRVAEHIYVGSKSDFYDITDGLPQQQTWDE